MNKQEHIMNMLIISTAHIPEWLAQQFINGNAPVECVLDTGYGWILNRVAIEAAVNERPEGTVPDCLKEIAALALANHCSWINLDRDWPEIDELKTWEW